MCQSLGRSRNDLKNTHFLSMKMENTTEEEIIQFLKESGKEWVSFSQLRSHFHEMDKLTFTTTLRSLQSECKIERGIVKINDEQVSMYRIDTLGE